MTPPQFTLHIRIRLRWISNKLVFYSHMHCCIGPDMRVFSHFISAIPFAAHSLELLVFLY